MKITASFNSEELQAFKKLASIDCHGIACCNCPLNLERRFHPNGKMIGCIRNISKGIVYDQEAIYEE